MTGLVLLAVLGTEPWQKLDELERAVQAAELRQKPLADRLVAASGAFLDTRYVVSPLGEGEGKDPDPRIRFDAVDCVTLVEETLALSLAPEPKALVPVLDSLRYEGAPAWERRRHVFEAQWLPDLVRHGALKDVTRAYGGDATRHVTKVLDAKVWSEKSAKALDLDAEHRPQGRFGLDLVPAEVALEKLQKVTPGTVVVVVRADRPWLVTRVSHVGFLVQSKQGPMLRHASKSYGRVVDEPLAKYLKRNLDYGAWTVEGLALFEVVGLPH